MNKVYLALLLITIVIAIVIITLGITIKVTKNIECFTTEYIEKELGFPTDKEIKKHDNENDIHDNNKSVSVGDIIFMPNGDKETIKEYGCEYLRIKNGQSFNFVKPKHEAFINKFLDKQEGTYVIQMGSGAIGSSTEKSFKPENGKGNNIIFKKIGEDKVVKFKDAKIISDGIFNSTTVAPYFFTRSQSSDIETPWIEKPMEIKADVADIKSVLPNGKVYLYVCISTISN